jgi:ribonuclease HI
MLAIRRALNNPDRCQDVVAHRLIFCEAAQSLPTEDLLLDCGCCHRFLAYCCHCIQRQRKEKSPRRQFYRSSTDGGGDPPTPCHHFMVVFVDGACLGNGRDGATAGIGIAIGTDPLTTRWAIPINDDIDPLFVRTSQRAELLAAIHGIRKLAEYEDRQRYKPDKAREVHEESDKITWVITSDSEYVVLGMTEWAPVWKVSHACSSRPPFPSDLSEQKNGWRTSAGRKPKNLDLFQKLDAAVERCERENGVQIAFWHIPRVHNELADELAGLAARGQIVEPVQFE